MSALIKRVVWALSLPIIVVCVASCVPMGLPEYFVGIEVQDSHIPEIIRASARKSPIALIVPESSDFYRVAISSASRNRLGSQYLLGVFPLTSLYLQHDLESLLIEKTISQLKALGYRSYVVDQQHLNTVARTLAPTITIAPKLDISLNAYDAFFFRILSAQGYLQINYLSPQGTVMRSESREINKRQYRRTGFAPALAQILENALTESLKDVLDKDRAPYLPRARAQKALQPSSNMASPLLVFPITINDKLAIDINQLISTSYGFASTPPTSSGVPRRLIQRGLEYAARDAGLIVAAEIPPFPAIQEKVIPANHHLWYLSSTVEELSASRATDGAEALLLSMVLALNEQSPPTTQRIISLKRCQSRLPVVRNVDGYWAVTLERASAEIGEQFLNPQASTNSSTRCEDLPR